LVAKRKDLTASKSKYDFNVQKIINLQIEVESLEDGVKRIEKLQAELF
jgi:predicted  nucleic acid-binding Zn-ribbon protein